MKEAGVRVVYFRPPKPYALRRLTNRSHRRLLIADGRVGMTGGVGIAAEWTGNAQDPDHWRDTHIRVRGPVVRGMQGAFAEHWLEATGEVLAGEGYLPDLEPLEGGGKVQFVRSKSGVGDTNVEALYYLSIASAERSLDLTAAYFVPRPAFVEALTKVAESGTRVRILVPGPHIDKGFVRVAGRAAYGDAAARRGRDVRISAHDAPRQDDGGRRHVVVGRDGELRQPLVQLHDEVTLCVADEHFAAQLTESFEEDLERSERIDPQRWAQRGPAQRLGETASTLLRREL